MHGYIDANGNIGANGTRLYLSFLQQPNAVVQFYEFEFHRGDLGDPGRIAGIGNDLANAVTINLRVPGGVQTPFALGSTNVNFYVVRIDYHGGNDDVYVYRNPTGTSEADNAAAVQCYGDTAQSLQGVVRDALKAEGLTISAEALDDAVSRLGSDRGITRRELEKLALYAHGQKSVSIEDVRATMGDEAEVRIDEVMDEIVAFAELERFIDLPVRTYSSGMYMRLGFSVAAHIQSVPGITRTLTCPVVHI